MGFPSFLSRVPFQPQEQSLVENSENAAFLPGYQADHSPSLQTLPSVSILFMKLGHSLTV